MIKILRASAGSGKTYSLAKTYIRLLLSDSDPVAYRHILAVTFTNKATDEMKSRILKELHLLATDPEKSSYISDFVPSLLPTAEELKKKAGDLLLRILHDYSAFSVSTIDRFFQQTLKAFSREIGQFASYQVELDQKSLVAETVDRILDSLTEDDKGMLNWLSDSMMEQLEKGERPKLEKSLNDVANRLKSDEHRAVIEENGIDEEKAYSKESLTHMRKLMRSVISSYEKDMREAAAEVEKAFSDNGISPNDTSSGFIGKNLLRITGVKPGEEIRDFTDTFKRDASDFSKWFRKNDQPKYACLEGALAPPVAKLLSIYHKGSKAYRTAHILIKQIGGLGIASELRTEFQTLMKEKNVMSLDDSNVILKNIIDGADAPFIYEKLGTRFEHFLLDEFQDTSRVQWDNFRPLISNSDSQGFENLLVGDVKQSIYRWRGSDWKLMAKDVAEQFPRAGQESLKGNWRSLRGLVEFNNDFFAYAAGRLDNKHGSLEAGLSVSSIYGQREDKGFERQKAMTKDTAEGLVEAIFCDAEEQDQYILQTIREVMEAGALPGDITILVRNNTEGSHVASMLMDEGYNVISDDSLRLKSSPAVRKLVSLLASVRNPEDTIGSFLAREAGFDAGELSYHSLPDLCERLVRILKTGEDRESFDSETLYLQSFMDYVQDHVATNGNSLDSFLRSWEDGEDPKVSSPSDTGAVRVMTIHKSKGLEFPYVILPYSDKVGLYRSGTSWTVPDVEGTALEKMGKAAFDVSLSSKSEGTLFEEDYQKDRLLQYIDNINLYYVALTRASKGMTIISDIGCSAERSMAGILMEYLKSQDPQSGSPLVFRRGEMYDFTKLDRSESLIYARVSDYPSFPLNPETSTEEGERSRLRVSSEALDFFTEEGSAASLARHNGTVLHDILSRVRIPSDLGSSVHQAVIAGDLEASREKEVEVLLAKRIAGHPDWFPEKGAKILNETSLIDSDGREWRPDRVVVKDGTVTIIDYKFGQKVPGYRSQVARYAAIYRRLGFGKVNTFLWYVPSDEVE